jgi:hypothetical protein
VFSHKLEIATNTLNGHVYADCTCGTWRRVWPAQHYPGLQEAESDHEAHSQRAGAEELRNGVFTILTRTANPLLTPIF